MKKKKEEIKICDANCYNSWAFCSIFEKLKLCISYNFNTHIYYTRWDMFLCKWFLWAAGDLQISVQGALIFYITEYWFI